MNPLKEMSDTMYALAQTMMSLSDRMWEMGNLVEFLGPGGAPGSRRVEGFSATSEEEATMNAEQEG